MANTADLSLDRQGSLVLPFALSVLFHAFFVLLFAIRALNSPAPAAAPFEVQLLQPQESPSAKAKAQADAQAKAAEKAPPEQAVPPPKNQIVSPPDSPEQTPEKAHLFSDRDSKAIEEMIKRGEPAPPAKPPQQPAKPDNAKPSPADKQPATKSKGEAQG